MAVAFYLKRGGLKALIEMKGTYNKESIMHVIRIVKKEERNKGEAAITNI